MSQPSSCMACSTSSTVPLTLDVPVGMLGNISPREAARTAAGRERLVVWLKHLENSSANRDDPTDPMATYDFGWMWRELGLEGLRR